MKKLLLAAAALVGLLIVAPPLTAQGTISRPRLFPYHTAFGNLAQVDQFNTYTNVNLYDRYTGANTSLMQYGLQVWQKFEGSENSTAQLYGMTAIGDAAGSKNIQDVYGGYFDGHATGSGTVSTLNGLQGTAVNYGSGSIAWGTGLLGYVQNYGTGTMTNGVALWVGGPIMSQTKPITNAYGAYVAAPACQAGTCSPSTATGLYIADQTFNATTNYALDVNGKFRVLPDGSNVRIEGLKTTGAASGKKVVCVDTATGQLYASSTSTDCSN